MIKPLFFVQSVVTYKAKNKAQQVVYDTVGDIEYKTLDDASTLTRLERFLVETCRKAHRLYPRSAGMLVRKYSDTRHLHRYEIFVPSTKGEANVILIIKVASNQGAWRGGGL